MDRERRDGKGLGGARYNRWYGRMKGGGIPGYLRKGWTENMEQGGKI